MRLNKLIGSAVGRVPIGAGAIRVWSLFSFREHSWYSAHSKSTESKSHSHCTWNLPLGLSHVSRSTTVDPMFTDIVANSWTSYPQNSHGCGIITKIGKTNEHNFEKQRQQSSDEWHMSGTIQVDFIGSAGYSWSLLIGIRCRLIFVCPDLIF